MSKLTAKPVTKDLIENLELTPLLKLTKDLKESAKLIGRDEARFLVNAYYTIQETRKRFNLQMAELEKQGKPNEVLNWMLLQAESLEHSIQRALDIYSMSVPIGARMRKVVGIGPVISAGLIAHIDMDIANAPSKIISFAGLSSTQVWEKGQKRPYNAELKTLCWKIGQSFLKLHNHKNCFYGPFYLSRKAQEVAYNEEGKFAHVAAAKLAKFKIGKNTEAYKYYSQGKLPPAHLNQRALRWTVKLFLSHLHENWLQELGRKPVAPWIIEHGGHVDIIPSNW